MIVLVLSLCDDRQRDTLDADLHLYYRKNTIAEFDTGARIQKPE